MYTSRAAHMAATSPSILAGPSSPLQGSLLMRAFFQKTPAYFSIWVFLRALSSLLAIFFSASRPITELENKIAVWPPAADIALWLNRVFLAPWLRWDANWYVHLLTTGYA